MAKQLIFIILACFLSFCAQAADQPETTQGVFTSNGKIYVVMAVLAMILVGVFLFLIRLDMKLRRLEKKESDI